MAYNKPKENEDDKWAKINAEKKDAIRRGQSSSIVLNKYDSKDITQENFDTIIDEIVRTYFCIVKADLKISEMLAVEKDNINPDIAKLNTEISKEGQKLELL